MLSACKILLENETAIEPGNVELFVHLRKIVHTFYILLCKFQRQAHYFFL